MIALHAGMLAERFLLWGEAPANPQGSSVKKRTRMGKSEIATEYAFGAGPDRLTESLKESSIGFEISPDFCEKIAVWMPTKSDRAIPSSPLIAGPPKSRAKTKLAPWTVTAYGLLVGEVLELLCACGNRRILAPGVVLGADITYWAEAMRFAGSLVARQQYLPQLTADDDYYVAEWEPVFTGKDAESLAALAKRMPAVARGISVPDEKSPPETPAITNLKDFIGALVDYLVRVPVHGQMRPATGRRKEKSKFDSAHDAWLDALQAPDGMVHYEESDLKELALQVSQWSHPISVSTSSPFRLRFRLEEPDETAKNGSKRAKGPKSDWYVRYLIQPLNDLSLHITVKDAWNPKGKKAAILKRYGSRVQEYLLSSLGQASGICSYIAGSLESPKPAGYELDALGAHQFLTERALSLERAGFTVMLPAWWTGKGSKVQLKAQAKLTSPNMQVAGTLSLEQVVQVDWEVALGGKKLTVKELEALAKLKAPLVRFRGQWVEMNSQEIQAAIEFWNKKSSNTTTVRDVIQMALGAKDAPNGFEFGGFKATGWVGKLLRQLDGRASFEELGAPERFSGRLRPYQARGYSWLSCLRQWGLGACLADDMGLGKTIQTLALIQRDWESNGNRPVLLICPTTVVNNWQKEAARFTPELPVMIHHGVGRNKGALFGDKVKGHAMVISSYGLMYRDIELLKEVAWGGVVLDEAQNVKNPVTKQARAARTLKADYRIALTGTPVENNVGDLWSIAEFLNPGFLGTQTEFKRNFFLPIQARRDPVAAERLKRITGPFILRRLKTDKSIISDLPDKMEMKVFCPLTKEQASLYRAVVRDTEEAMKSAEGIERKGLILATLSKLKQVCNHPLQFLHDNSSIPGRSGKLARLTEMLEEVVELGERALVFSQFTRMGGILQRHLQESFGREILFLHGGIPRKQRDRMVDRFQNRGEGPSVFILSLKAGGTGLNLTEANHVFHFDRWWNPAVENQATDRAFRIGQTRNVQVHKFICAGTLEDKIDEMIERKKDVAEEVIGTGEGWLTELSNKELKSIFALRKEAIGE